MSTRLDILLKFYDDDPNDPFNIYALAIEYQKSDLPKARQYFEKLLNEYPHYIPTYYHAAKLYQETGDTDRAINTYEKGIEVAKSQNDTKAARELKSAYDELMF
ncbi:MAG TPA: tetratricopeptide repeat protein [Chryseosolibacter sp.]